MQGRISRVAVIAVHGVADQKPNETARSVASLLLNLPRSDSSALLYTAFIEEGVHVAQRPVVINDPPSAKNTSKYSLHSQYAQQCFAGTLKEREKDEPDYGFMKSLLSGAPKQDKAAIAKPAPSLETADPPHSTYQTLRLSSLRQPGSGLASRIDIFEMYWGDLSRLGQGFWRILSEFYQFLFHLSSLGRHTIDLARAERLDSWGWWLLSKVQALSARLMSLPIPIFNFFLLLTALLVVPSYLPEKWQTLVAAAVGGVGTSWLVGRALFRHTQLNFSIWATLPFVAGIAAALIIYGLLAPAVGGMRVVVAEWALLLGFTLIAVTFRAYDRHRPGAKRWAWVIGVPAFLLWLIYLGKGSCQADVIGKEGCQEDVIRASLWTSEWIFVGLMLVWCAYLLINIAVWLSGTWVLWEERNRGPVDAAKASRAIWTGRLALAIPAALYVAVTLSLWAALMLFAQKFIPSVPYQPVFPPPSLKSKDTDVASFMKLLLEQGATPAFDGFLILLGFALVLAAWALFPVVWAEVKPPASPYGERSAELGEWLNKGFKLLRWAGRLVFFLVIAFPFATLVAFREWFPNPISDALYAALERVDPPGISLLNVIAVAVVGSAVGLIAFTGRLNKITGGFRSVLDVALDVDNWLREHPRDANPRLRICARYVSLLRHICNWQDAEGRGYDAVVIAAHSQGTVITADLLRFLKKEAEEGGDPALAKLGGKLKVYLLTFGNPLRQLYGLRFPHLYGWARHTLDEPWLKVKPPFIPENQKPDPLKLGVDEWVNAYRSGDYVGRYLWRSEICDYHWLPPEQVEPPNVPVYVSFDKCGRRRELCIGAGAHTHYLDTTAQVIAEELDRLIHVAANDRSDRELKSQEGGNDA